MWKRAVSALFQRKIPSENSLENEIVRQENSPFIHCKGGRHPGELRVPNELQASVILMLPLVRIVENSVVTEAHADISDDEAFFKVERILLFAGGFFASLRMTCA